MGAEEKIQQIKEEMARTQVNKATEFHLGVLKAKIAKLKRDAAKPKSGVRDGGFAVRKTGDATVVMVGLPSVGKSTILNSITNADSRVAAYAFTTLTTVPGILEHKGAKIQVLDLPGILEGAASGRGRGKEVIAVARSADVILIILDVFNTKILPIIMNELAEMGIRPDGKPPNIVLKKKHTGGITINSTVKLTKLNERTIKEILNVYEVHNGDILFHEDADTDRLIDYLVGNRVYIPLLVIVNKTDLVDPNYLKQLDFPHLAISAEKKANLGELREAIYKKLKLIRLYLRHRDGEVDYEEPMIIKQDAVIEDVCNKIHTDMAKTFKYAQVWGKSAHFGGEKAGLAHKLEDGDVVLIVNK
ncbi:MAG: GTP-binding protein [Candidatus Burarchaeum sp.]|nr:GTP-binding protein [Candidatus Burarchaeum sp.]MDO8340160.1 GTP-binding protein [Candidatus Burarchaeum sp.]